MKSYTDLPQSKKLVEILPLESADMWWSKNFIYYNPTAIIGISAEYSNVYTYKFGEDDIPCWSLTALLDIFPCSKESPIVNLTRGGWNPSFTRRWFATWEDENKNIFYSCNGASPVDAVVELIMKLHEQNIL